MERLSQQEIDQLLSAIANGDTEEPERFERNRKIKIYDFKRPDTFTREQMRTIMNAFEVYAKAFKKFIESYKKGSKCSIYVASVDQLTFEEFLRSIPTPTELNVLKVKMHKRGYSLVTELDPALSFYLLDLPVDKKKACKNRDLTDTEIKRWEKEIVSPNLNILKKSLNLYFDTEIKVIENVRTEMNPSHAECVDNNSMVCLVTLEVKIDDEEGFMNVCLPASLALKLCNDYNRVPEKDVTALDKDRFKNSVKVNIKAALGNASLTIADAENLGEGSIIKLDRLAGEPLDIEIDGKVFAKAEVVVIDDTFGVRLVEMV